MIKIATSFNIDLEFEGAPFYKRLLSWILDTLVMVTYVIVALRLLNWFAKQASPVSGLALFMVLLLPYLTYHLLCEVLMNGQSIGKKIMRLQVVNEKGGQPGLGQYIIRWLIRTSDYMVVVILLFLPEALQRGDADFAWKIAIPAGLLLCDVVLVNTGKGQRLGDLLAHTLVICKQQEELISSTVFLEVDENYVPSFPQIMHLSDADINALKGILDTAKQRHDYSLAEMAAEKIKHRLKINTPLSAFDFLETLLKDYNYLSVH